MITAGEISQKLSIRAEEVARLLLPDGRRVGGEFEIGSILGQPGRSCKIRLSGDKAGVWSDFSSGEAGDLLDLWAAVKGVSLGEAIKQAKDYLGIVSPSFESYKRSFVRPQKPDCKKPVGPVYDYLAHRGLEKEVIERYKVGEQGRKIVFPYLRAGELLQVKYIGIDRIEGKKVISVEKECEPCLFGWQAIPDKDREVTICEGEIDAMTLSQYGFPALSVPFGGGKGGKQAWIEHEFENLERFDVIYLCMDQDKEGKLAEAELAERLGRHRCRSVVLPHKDANECFMRGVEAPEVKECFQRAKTLDPAQLKSALNFVDDVIKEFYPSNSYLGVQTPWASAKNKIIFRPGELSIWTGVNGHGKSMVLNQVMLEAMSKGEKVCIASLELRPRRLLYRMTRQATGENLPEEILIRTTHEWFDGKLWIFDLVGTAKDDLILEVFKYARHRYGITHFVIDSLMKCGMGEDDYNKQKLFVEKLADFKNEHDVHVHLVAHARKGESEDRVPGKLDVKGTGTITDLADNTFSIWRNKKKEESIKYSQKMADQSDAILLCDKQRNGDWEGKIRLWWNKESYQFSDSESLFPTIYVQ